MMETENPMSERFDNVVDELPDELNERREKNGVIEEESDDEEQGMEGGVDGEEMMSGGNKHKMRVIKKVGAEIIKCSIIRKAIFSCNLVQIYLCRKLQI